MSLPRERLTALLADSALTSVELVIAPPGFGKTTLLREYASAETGVAFAALPEATDLEAFVRSVMAATVPSALQSIGALFDGSQQRNVEEHVAEWLTSRLREFGGTLIIDDLHRVVDERAVRVLVATVAATNGRMRWIIASRESPAIPMGSWIARGWMGLPITGDDLGFTVDEARALADSLQISATDEALRAIVDETVGWPIGVRLALSLVARDRGITQTRVQTREALFALLDDEVWKALDDDLRRLVAAAALLPAPAIRTLEAAGFLDARSAMARVFAKVPFIQTIDDENFAIHDLFREFVATQNLQHAVARDGTVSRMGSALVTGGNAADGLRLLISAGDAAGVSGALERHAFDLLETGQRSSVTAAVSFLDEHGLGDSGVALAIRGALAFNDGSPSNSTNLFIRALERGAPPAIRGEVARRLAVSYVTRGMFAEAIETLRPIEADPLISSDDKLQSQALSISFLAATGQEQPDRIDAMISTVEAKIPTVRPSDQALLLQRLGLAAFYNSDFDKAERLSQDAALMATDLGMDKLASVAFGTLYSLAAFNDAGIERARSFSRSQAVAAARAANTALHVYALRVQYIIAAIDGDIHEAAALESALASMADSRTHLESFLFRQARILHHVSKAEISKAEAVARAMPVASLTPSERIRSDSLFLLLALLNGRRSEVSAMLERGRLTEAPSDFGGRIEMAYAYAFRGVAFWVLDRPAQARRQFELNVASLPRRDRIFFDAFKALSMMPHPLPNSGAIDGLFQTLAAAGFRAYATLLRLLVELNANDVELSAAELETLREFDRFGGRASDVAKALGKSKFTVQNQIQSAIRKLGCSGRAEALAYARQRGWLDRASN